MMSENMVNDALRVMRVAIKQKVAVISFEQCHVVY